ncbi:hypothetical protein BSPWISOXPB_3918 [uncultured Gammaproteobacteria bacterium]|nr:hypothetical protein BSPWISOXPB_3918 [uncultured Gammaproteobacteria bacterium]
MKDYQNGNFDNTKSNIIERIIPKAIERNNKSKKKKYSANNGGYKIKK